MFKKLKQKIIEEQTSGRGSPAHGTSAFTQRSSESSALSPSIHRNRTSSLTEQNDDSTSTPNREKKCQKIHLWAIRERTTRFISFRRNRIAEKSLQSECNKKLEDMQLEVETFQTRLQTELEALSSELSDALNSRQNLEQYISKLKEDANKAKVEFEAKLDQQRNNHKEQVEAILKDQEIIEKSLKEEIIQLLGRAP